MTAAPKGFLFFPNGLRLLRATRRRRLAPEIILTF